MMRSNICAPLTGENQFIGTFVRKNKTKSGKPQYYLYSKENEDLILCASENAPLTYIISQSATNISLSNEFYIGTLTGNRKDCRWTGILGTPPVEQITIEYVKASDKKQEVFREVKIVINSSIELPQRQPVKIGDKYLMQSPAGIESVVSQKNMIIDSPKGHSAIIFQKCSDEEFYLSVREPCSIFHGFCLALSTLKKFGKE